MKTNTTEQTNINDTDLFLVSDTTGENIKYITGINLKQQGLTHLEGGDNINLTTNVSNGDTIINLDNNIDTAGSITCENFVKIKKSSASSSDLGGILSLESSLGQLSYPFRYKSQVFHTDVGDAFQIVGEDNASNQRLLFELHSGTNTSTRHTADFNNANIASVNSAAITALTGTSTINTYNSNVLTVNNNNQQYLIKDTNKNFGANDILSVDSNFKLSPITATTILGSLIAGNNLGKSGNTLNVDANLTGITSINSTSITQLLTISAHPTTNTLGGVLKLSHPTTTAEGDLRDFELANSIEGSNDDKVLTIRGINDTDTTVFLQIGEFLNSKKLISYFDFLVTIATKLRFNVSENSITLANDISSIIFGQTVMNIQKNSGADHLDYQIKTSSGTLALNSTGGTSQKIDLQINSTDIISLDNTVISCNRTITTNQNPINLYAPTDTNHQITYSGIGMDGVLIRGFGNSGVPFFRLQTSDGDVNVLDAYTNKINMLKPLHMNANLISFQPNNESHFIQYSGVNMNGVEVAGFGSGLTPVFRVKRSSGSDPYILECERSKVILYKPLVFRIDNADTTTTTNITIGSNSVLSVNIVESGEFRINNSSTNHNYFKTIAQGSGANGRTFFFEQGGDSGSSNGGSFQAQCSQGKMLFQSDRNLVIYNPDGSVAFSANDTKNAHSSRDYKTNINDLVEDESVNIIKNINPVSYEYKEQYWDDLDKCDSCNCNVRKGFIWEDIKPILPQSAKSVNMNNPDYPMTKLLDLREIIPDLTKTVQYLLNEITTLKQQLVTQSTLISNLQ